MPSCSGAGAPVRRVLVGGDRVALVVAPAAADQQVPGRVALQPEARAAGERDRRRVRGLDVGLQPVQRHRAEREVEHELHRLAHQPLAGVARARVVAEVGGLEVAADDLGDREHADEVAVVGAHRREADEVVAAGAVDEVVELVGALRRVGPGLVQVAALAHHREERLAVGEREVAEHDAAAGARRARRGEDLLRAGPPQQPPSQVRAHASPMPLHESAPEPGAGAIDRRRGRRLRHDAPP